MLLANLKCGYTLFTLFTCYLLVVGPFSFFVFFSFGYCSTHALCSFFFQLNEFRVGTKGPQIIISIVIMSGGILFTTKRLYVTLIYAQNEMQIQMRIRFGYSYKYVSPRICVSVSFIPLVSQLILVIKYSVIKYQLYSTGFEGKIIFEMKCRVSWKRTCLFYYIFKSFFVIFFSFFQIFFKVFSQICVKY